MDRRDFCGKVGCGAAGLAAFPAVAAVAPPDGQERAEYAFSIDIVEGRDTPCGAGHKPGDHFRYPEDSGQICPWLMDSMSGFLRVLEYGGTLFWTYRGTPYEKEMDPDGVTTEFVRCPDPTASGIVAKITRTRLS